MKTPPRVLLSILVATLLAGCFQSEIVVSVKPDGSGTVTETFLMSKAMVEQMKKTVAGFDGAAEEDAKSSNPNAKAAKSEEAVAPKEFSLINEKKLKEAASKMGKGVTFVSAKKHSTDKGEGYIATYAFTDINQLRIDQDRSDAMTDTLPGMTTIREGEPEAITFQFKKGKIAELTIKNPADRKIEEDKSKEDKQEVKEKGGINLGQEEMAKMMQEMFTDMKVTIAVEFAGKIVKTNAEYVAGNRVTLMEMDFNKVLANPAKFKELNKAKPASVEATKALLKGIDGIKAEMKPSVSVQFQ